MDYLTVEYLYKVLSMSIVTLSYPKTHCLGQNEIPSNEFEKRVERKK